MADRAISLRACASGRLDHAQSVGAKVSSSTPMTKRPTAQRRWQLGQHLKAKIAGLGFGDGNVEIAAAWPHRF
jgi:hypothetical protein